MFAFINERLTRREKYCYAIQLTSNHEILVSSCHLVKTKYRISYLSSKITCDIFGVPPVSNKHEFDSTLFIQRLLARCKFR